MCGEGGQQGPEGGLAPPAGGEKAHLGSEGERETLKKMGFRERLGAEPWLMGIPGPG